MPIRRHLSPVIEITHHVTIADIQKLLAGEGGVDLARVIENGKQVAMRIFGVSPGSTAARLGAQNDDTIESINDIALTDIAAAYRAGEKASQSDRIEIRGKRKGVPYVTILIVNR